jgi:hypothetical protein
MAGGTNPFLIIDPALLDNSTTANPLTNQLTSQDGSATDGNSMPAGEPVHRPCSLSAATEPIVQPTDQMPVARKWTLRLPRHLHAWLL